MCVYIYIYSGFFTVQFSEYTQHFLPYQVGKSIVFKLQSFSPIIQKGEKENEVSVPLSLPDRNSNRIQNEDFLIIMMRSAIRTC